MFKLDSRVKREALNFSTMLNVLKCTEKRLNEKFDAFSKQYDVTLEIDMRGAGYYADFFCVEKDNVINQYRRAKTAFEKLEEKDEIIKRGSRDYPKLLEATEEAPRYLYLRGNKELLYENKKVAVVGSRQASDAAILNTIRLSRDLGKNGITVVSGLAKGIDVNAHQAALEGGYNTIAVIGTGLNKYYPIENKHVQKEIERRGLVVSQFSPAMQISRWCFPMRNGVMSGLSLATVIMEAGETSGALKQADYAMKQKRLVMIPRKIVDDERINWPRKYIAKGAKIVEKPADVIVTLENFDTSNMNIAYEQMNLFG